MINNKEHTQNELSIVLPTMNEAQGIAILVNEIATIFYSQLPHLIFIDDSTDETPEIIKSTNYPNIELVQRRSSERDGLLSAITLGIFLASSERVAVMDSDGQHPVQALKQMKQMSQEENYDYISGSRYIQGANSDGLNSWQRKMIAPVLGHFIKAALKLPISDPLTNFCLFKKERVNEKNLANMVRPNFMRIQIALLLSSNFSNITEIPITFSARKFDKSKMTPKKGFMVLYEAASMLLKSHMLSKEKGSK